jgi:hypothetical protein
MKKVIIKNKQGIQTHGAEMIDPTQWIADCIAGNYWGLPERIVDDVEGTYNPADVIEYLETEISPEIPPYLISQEIEGSPAIVDEDGNVVQEEVLSSPAIYSEAIPAVTKKQVKLKAEYTIEIVDISQEHALQECIANRKAEYPTMEEFLNVFFDGKEEAMQELHARRLAIKNKYPKPTK